MGYGRFIKRWIGILLALMVSVCAIACQKKGRAKDPINTFFLDLYVTTDTDEDPTRVYGVEHSGTQPQMYLYEITDYHGKPFYAKIGKPRERYSLFSSIDEKLYRVTDSPLEDPWSYIYVRDDIVLRWEIEILHDNGAGAFVPAYAIRLEWKIFIDEDPPVALEYRAKSFPLPYFDGKNYPSVDVIRTVDELAAYAARENISPPTSYDEDFFAGRLIIVLELATGNSAVQYSVVGVEQKGDALSVRVENTTPDGVEGAAVMGAELFVIELDKKAFDGTAENVVLKIS
ncbi:MAG: hypothetical protein IJY63_05590 [Clostridia bacterium]|nr:hypothetical protein [Clostridia bacterium]